MPNSIDSSQSSQVPRFSRRTAGQFPIANHHMSYSLRASQRLRFLLPSLQKKPTFNLKPGPDPHWCNTPFLLLMLLGISSWPRGRACLCLVDYLLTIDCLDSDLPAFRNHGVGDGYQELQAEPLHVSPPVLSSKGPKNTQLTATVGSGSRTPRSQVRSRTASCQRRSWVAHPLPSQVLLVPRHVPAQEA